MIRIAPLPCLALGLALAVVAALPARAEVEADTRRSIERVQRALEKSRADEKEARERERALAEEVSKLRADMVATAKAVQEREREATAVEDELHRLEQSLREARAGLLARRGQLVSTLGALERIALRPPEAAFGGSQSPLDTMRGAVLLRAALPPLEADAASFRADIDELAGLRREVRRQRGRHLAALAETKRERTRLAALVTRKEELRRRSANEGEALAGRIDNLKDEARDLRALLDRLESERKAAAEAQRVAEAERRRREAAAREAAAREAAQAARSSRPPAAAQPAPPEKQPSGKQAVETPPAAVASAPMPPMAGGAYLFPAQGRIVQRFGQGSGITGRGILLTVRDGAQVVAPHDGKVVYAGPFRGYGVLLIIEHHGGYHTLLSGMTSLDVETGQWVLAGEPVGSITAVDGAVPNLYVELRHKGQPVDPLARLAARNG